jgi:hypothetical protein
MALNVGCFACYFLSFFIEFATGLRLVTIDNGEEHRPLPSGTTATA